MGIDRLRMVKAFDEGIDRLEQALRDCPADRWQASVWPVLRTDPWVWPSAGTEPVPERTEETIQQLSAFWVVAYHALFFLDLYATIDASTFSVPPYAANGPEELGFAADGAVALPGPAFGRDALLEWAEHGRQKVHATITAVTDEQLATLLTGHHPRAGETFEQVLRVNLAHVDEHGSQLAGLVSPSAPA